LRGGFQARREIEDLASGFRLAGAACLTTAQQVAAWLDRRELRRPRDPEQDAGRIVSLLRHRPVEWRRDLAVRLAGRLRPPTGRRWRWRRWEGMPGWDLVAALMSETGIEPPDGDAFVVGWVWHSRRRANGERRRCRPRASGGERAAAGHRRDRNSGLTCDVGHRHRDDLLGQKDAPTFAQAQPRARVIVDAALMARHGWHTVRTE
jgi:hypothetical protein